jgi:hypothetical protein
LKREIGHHLSLTDADWPTLQTDCSRCRRRIELALSAEAV